MATPAAAAHRAVVSIVPRGRPCRVTPATVADHIEQHRSNCELFRLGKLRSLCAECHDALDARNRAPERPRSFVRADGTATDPRHPWNRS